MKKKEPIHKRLEYANEILDQIIDSARKPLTVSNILFSIFLYKIYYNTYLNSRDVT